MDTASIDRQAEDTMVWVFRSRAFVTTDLMLEKFRDAYHSHSDPDSFILKNPWPLRDLMGLARFEIIAFLAGVGLDVHINLPRVKYIASLSPQSRSSLILDCSMIPVLINACASSHVFKHESADDVARLYHLFLSLGAEDQVHVDAIMHDLFTYCESEHRIDVFTWNTRRNLVGLTPHNTPIFCMQDYIPTSLIDLLVSRFSEEQFLERGLRPYRNEG